MSEPNQAFQQKLRAIFAGEAGEHLQHIETALLALERAGALASAALVDPALKALHTLKGAARAVDLDHLERLCHALEGVCSSARGAPAALAPADFDTLYQAVARARELSGPHSGRVRNAAAALCTELDRMADRLAHASTAPAHELAPVPPAAAASEFMPAPAGGADAPDEPAGAALPELVRVDAAQLDAIRTEAEALLGVELGLQHQLGELRALAAEMAESRREAERRGAGAAVTAPELTCARLARQIGATAAALAAARKRLMGKVLDTALVPFSAALDELPALVRKLSRSRGREVLLAFEGEGVQMDRRVLGVIREALIHLVANAVDHGIETTGERVAAGKPATGQLRITAVQRDARHVLVRVADDGAGLDPDALARAAGADPREVERLDAGERLQLALRAGVSTRAEVTTVSGRGMGLAIVAEKVAAVGGTLAIESARGQGAAFEMLLPVSLASIRALVVRAGGARCVAPLAALESVRAVAAGDVRTVENRETLALDGKVLPLLRLAALFGAAAEAGPATGVALVVPGAGRRFALLVDAILAELDVLPRPLGPLLRRVRGVSAATELGDGALVPLLALDDIARIGPVRAAAPEGPGGAQPGAGAGRRVLVVEDSITSRLLLKHILEGAGFAVETAVDGLEALSRLRQRRFDALVSDVEMPHMDGLALTEAVRANPDTAELPVILVTSLQMPAERERGLHAGADAYLTKGAFDQDQLLATLRRLT
jgi:two-component system chemotaxis sensor kinase CheA